MNAHPELYAWAQGWAQNYPELQPRPMFGSPAWFLEGKLRVCVIGNGVAFKGQPAAVARVRRDCPWAGPFLAHGRTMGPAWVFLTPPDPSHAEGLAPWAEQVVFSGPLSP